MDATYNPWLVALSIVVAMVVAYTALKLVARVADEGRDGNRVWLIGGALAMGIGIWSMHFIGMLAYSVDIPLRYDIWRTVVSLIIAMVTSGFGLELASGARLGLKRLIAGSLVMGAGISAMHYSGMSAIQITPMIAYAWDLVVASIAIAVGASFAGLWLAFRLRSGSSRALGWARAGAAVVMGLAISGMHYTGMAASRVAVGAYCSTGTSFDNDWIAGFIGITALAVLALTLITAVFDAHLVSRTRRNAARLEQTNAELQHGKNLLSLATQAAGICSWELDVHTRRAVWMENDIEALRSMGIDTKQNPNAMFDLMHPDDSGALCEAIRAAGEQNRDTFAFRFRVLTPMAAIVHVQAHARVHRDEAGQPARILGVSWDVTEELGQSARHRELELQLRETSRNAGMAEIATGVLHNVGNVLNSLGVSASLLQSRLRGSKTGNVQRVADLFEEHRADLPGFLVSERGREVPNYLAQLGTSLAAENREMLREIDAIANHVGHIRNIVAAQQTYARRGGATELVDVRELLDSAVAVHFTEIKDVVIRREYAEIEPVMLDRHKLLQIFGNLLSNARHALRDVAREERRLTLRLRRVDATHIGIEVQDTGIGISADTLARLFEFGFTTKRNGHGFGLHTCAILAKELGGAMKVTSDGLGHGATFEVTIGSAAAESRKRA
ncbi:MAG TPA: MHYT domain-containing protein [Steroidobacteraceae bacterium]|nr:MHYT domain-containing protein [Steroidobacteraceae bacterium]